MNELRGVRAISSGLQKALADYKGPLLFLLLLMTLGLIPLLWPLSCMHGRASDCQFDFYMFWTEAKIIQDSESENLYDPEEAQRLGVIYRDLAIKSGERRRIVGAQNFTPLQPISTPFLYATFAWWTGEDFSADLFLFFCAAIVAYLAAIFFLVRFHRLSREQTIVVLFLLFWCFFPLMHDITAGNVASFQLLMLCVLLGLASPLRGAVRCAGFGAVAAVAVLFKPVVAGGPLLFALFLLLRRRHRDLAALAAGGVLAAAAVVAVVARTGISESPWRAWLAAIDSRVATVFDFPNGSPAALLDIVAGPVIRWDLAVVCIGAAVSTALVLRAMRGALDDDATQGLLVFHLGLTAGVLMAKPLWPHYFVLLLPVIFEGVFPRGRRPQDRIGRRTITICTILLLCGVLDPAQFAGSSGAVAWARALMQCAYGIVLYSCMAARLVGTGHGSRGAAGS